MKLKKVAILLFLTVFAILAPSLLFSSDKLHKAAYNGDIKTVKIILKDRINPDERDSFGGTALHAAMFQDNMKIVELLIEAGLDVNAQGTYNKYTPLHDAVWANNLQAAKLLVKHGSKIDIKSVDRKTAYEKALDEDKKEMAEYLHSLEYSLAIY